MQFDALQTIALILIGSFAIDRVVSGLFFLLAYNDDLRASLDPSGITDPREQADAKRNYRLLYAIFGGYLSIVVMAGYMNLRLFSTAAVPGAEVIGQYQLLDIVLTGLVLLGGADRLAEFLKMPGTSGGATQPEAPLEIRGTLVLQQSAANSETGG